MIANPCPAGEGGTRIVALSFWDVNHGACCAPGPLGPHEPRRYHRRTALPTSSQFLHREAVSFNGLYVAYALLDGFMRNTPDALRFIGLPAREGVGAVIAERDRPFADYSQGTPEEHTDPTHVIHPPCR